MKIKQMLKYTKIAVIIFILIIVGLISSSFVLEKNNDKFYQI